MVRAGARTATGISRRIAEAVRRRAAGNEAAEDQCDQAATAGTRPIRIHQPFCPRVMPALGRNGQRARDEANETENALVMRLAAASAARDTLAGGASAGPPGRRCPASV